MIYGNVHLPEPGEGEMVIEAIVLSKVIDKDGKTRYREWKSEDLHPIEALGMIETARDTVKSLCMGRLTQRLRRAQEPSDPEEER